MNEQTLRLLEDPEGFIRGVIAKELEPLRAALLRPAGEKEPAVESLVGALEIAEICGFDTSTDKARRAARQRVYDLARQGHIPSVRVSPRRVRFDPAAVRRRLAAGGARQGHTNGLQS